MLRHEIREKFSQGMLKAVWFFDGCSVAFLKEVLERTSTAGYCPAEMIGAHDLQILLQGIVARGGAIISMGSDPNERWWGDIILCNPVLRDMRLAKVIT